MIDYTYSDAYQNPTPYIAFPIQTFIRPLYQNCDPRFKTNLPLQETLTDNLSQKTDDELWIETYLSKIGKININLHSNVEIIPQKPPKTTTNKKKVLNLHQAKFLLHKSIKLLSELEKLEEYLRENVATISSAEWKEKTVEIGQQKDEFTSLVSQFDDRTVLKQLNRIVKNRRKKRLSQKRKKVARREEMKETLKNRQLLHKKIDNWLDDMKYSVEKAKRDEYLQKDADCILSEVTKKKSDARKQISMLLALVKLRAVREQAAVQRGEKISLEDSKAFKHNTERLQVMWEQALKIYSIEEQGLRAMLEKDAAKNVNAASCQQRKITKEWERALFGPNIVPCDAYWGLTCAEKDLGTFIAIRKSWDTFLVSNSNSKGTRIPIGWILPNVESPNEQWSKYLEAP